jgi:hypothetical protein
MNAVLARKRLAPAPVPLSGPAIIAQPTTPSEIAQILTDAKRYPSPVRPIGSGSSITRCITANGGTLLDLSMMNRILSIDEDTVTVQPGIPLVELAEQLCEAGLELIGGYDLANRTVGGAVCGAGLEASIAGSVSQFGGHVTQLKVISPQGKKIVVSEKTKSLLGLMRLSYGLLGAIYEVTLRIRPIEGFSSRTARVSFKDFPNIAPRLTAADSGVKLVLLPFRDCIFFELRQPSKNVASGKETRWRIRDWAMYSALPTVAKTLARALPIKQLRYPIMDNISETTQSLVSGREDTTGSNASEQSGRYRSIGQQKFTYCTWAFPAADIARVVLSYKLFCREHHARTGFRCDMPTIAYRLNQDRSALLSPSFDGPIMTLSPLSTESRGWDDFVFNFAEFAMNLNGIPLFNQTRNATAESVNRTYGNRLRLFSRVRQSFDPGDRMLNQFFLTYLS